MEPGKLLLNEWVMVIFFMAGVTIWGVMLKDKGKAKLSDSFLAGRKVPGFIGCISTVATNMNANDFIGGAGAIYAMGIVMIHSSLINSLVILFLAFILMRKLRGRNVFTLGEWLRKRYSDPVGNLYSIIWAFIWMLFNLGLYIYAGAIVMHTLVGWDLYFSIVFLTVVAATYTILGGFGAVVATDVVQLVLMFFPFIFLAGVVWMDVGGPINLINSLPADKVAIWNPDTPFGPLGFTIFGMLFLAMSYWSSEAQIIQRPLSTRNTSEAAITYIGTGFWHTLIVPFIVYIPAMAAIKYFPSLPNNDFAMPMLIKNYLPHGLYGITIVGLLAGNFSSADSQINAFCTMFTTDIYSRMINKNASQEKLIKVSRLSGIIFTVAAIGTAFIFTFAKNGMFLLAVGILATIMPPFGSVTILGALWRRSSPRGALWGVIIGLVVGSVLFTADMAGYLADFAKDTLYFRAFVSFLVTTVVTVAISLAQNFVEPEVEHEDMQITGRGLNNPKILGVFLVSAVVVVYAFLAILL